MQDIRMGFEMPHTQQAQPSLLNHQSSSFSLNAISNFSAQQSRPMNLYSKTNHNQNMVNNNTNSSSAETSFKTGDVLQPTKMHTVPAPAPRLSNTTPTNNNSNNLVKLRAIANTFVPHSPISSEEDNSPTEMNNCRRMMDKPPLVKRLTMGLLMRTTEESRPLVYNTHNHSPQLNNNTASPSKGSPNCDGYVNEAVCERHQPPHSVLDQGQNPELNFKKNMLREASSGKWINNIQLVNFYKPNVIIF